MKIVVPSVGESIYEALIAKWHKQNGQRVVKDDLLCELETDKITLELRAETDGVLTIGVAEGTTVKIGSEVGEIVEQPGADYVKRDAPVTEPKHPHESPSARKTARESSSVVRVPEKSGGSEVQTAAETGSYVRSEDPVVYGTVPVADGRITRVPMTPIRKRIAERLMAVRLQTAMVTTFNEVDISRIMAIRKRHGESFLKSHGVKLGIMSFFVKACCEALARFSALNASIEGSDIVYHNYYDIGIAVSGEKGLVVPVIRNADRLHFWEIEQAIASFGEKVRTGSLVIADLEGGTFSISNGGIFGSMLSTPLLNPPQSGVLGMHAIQDRPIVREGQIVIRPMMYLALTYDHRIVDGHEAVGFLAAVKEVIEEPEEMLLEG